MQLKPLLNRSLRWLGFTLLLMTMLLVGTFGLLQTSIGLGWAGRLLGSVMSSPGFLVTLRGLDGSFPFDLRATRIEMPCALSLRPGCNRSRPRLRNTSPGYQLEKCRKTR